MQRAPFLVNTALILAGVLVTGAASAGGANLSSSEPPRKTTNSFNILYTATGPNAPVVVTPNGTGLPAGKQVVTNPYNVPLIQNAGLLRPGH